MTKKELIGYIKEQREHLPLPYHFLEPIKRETEATQSNYSSVSFKPGYMKKLQTNDMQVGAYYKPVSRIFLPVKETDGNNQLF
jgi:hypothetical protein